MQVELEEIKFTADELEDLTEKCLNFTELFCATEFFPYQYDMAKAMIRDIIGDLGNTLTGLFSRQSGKSELVANVAGALMVILPKLSNLKDENGWIYPQLRKGKHGFQRGMKVGIFSPSNTQSSTTYKRLRDKLTQKEGRELLEGAEFALEGNSLLPFVANSRDYIELKNGSFCLMMSADKQSNIESKTFHLILLDESQDLDDFVIGKSVMPMGASTNATAVATGTPGITKGYFYNMIETNKNMEMDRKRHDRKRQPKLHFQYDYKVAQKYNTNYRKYILKEKRKIGEDSDEFQMAYNLVWLLERGMAVSQELFETLSKPSLDVHTSVTDTLLVAGLDWGKGQDSTVLTIGRPLWDQIDEQGKAPVEVIYWWEKVGDDYEIIFAELKSQLANFSIDSIACDATGVGEPLVDRLTWELPNVNVIPVKFSSQSKDHLYKFFLLMLQEKKCTWPANAVVKKRNYFKKFTNQMLNLQKEYKNGYLACHAPEDIRGAHDDYPDSLALMLWCINEEAMPFVDVQGSDFYQGVNWHTWTPPTGANYMSRR